MKNLSKYVVVMVLSVFFVGMTLQSANSADKSLYDRLGGKAAISAVVDQFVSNVAADTRVNMAFANTDIPHFKQCLVDQICQATGGPCKYTCRSMKDSHAGLGCTNDNFTAVVEDLVAALNKFNVPKKEQDDLLAILGPLQKDIVEKP
ncbi:MAG TPA: group 1 truncated hemoglobin [Thermodesulfobacteriota bacterium]|nr:group 1 truncated hemoglobin [Thermodesulfobacteriota bacterium]